MAKTMQIVNSIEELRRALRDYRLSNPEAIVGLVPTMGALHAGHAELIRSSGADCDLTAVSIFVNPTQFNDPRDLERYPRSPDQDLSLCEQNGAGLVFMPPESELFPAGKPALHMAMPELTQTLCGPGRPGHFDGVLYIVARLFNLFSPDRAYFGKKDYQQYVLIRRLAAELNFALEVVGVPTVREANGLAMSSRNRLLDERSAEHAELIGRALKLAAQTYEDRGTAPAELAEIVSDIIASGTQNQVEYVDVVHPDTLERLQTIPEELPFFVIGVAVFCGGVRLIDNIEVPN